MVAGSRPSMPTRRSTTPLVPNDMIDLPVFASTSCSRLFIGEDEPLVAAVAALPVVDAAAGHAVHVLADPQLLAGLRVDRDERSVPAAAVDDAADDDRVAAGVADTDTSTPPGAGSRWSCRSGATRNSASCPARCRSRATTGPRKPVPCSAWQAAMLGPAGSSSGSALRAWADRWRPASPWHAPASTAR